jgi:hypothetical protein
MSPGLPVGRTEDCEMDGDENAENKKKRDSNGEYLISRIETEFTNYTCMGSILSVFVS